MHNGCRAWNNRRIRGVCIRVHPEEIAMFRVVAGLLLAAVAALAFAQAPANPPVRIRGTVEKIDGQMLTIKTAGGPMTVKLADNYIVMGIAKASVADIANGKFIG